MIHNHYPIPLISELITKIQGAKLLTKVNLRQGYNNACIKIGDEWKAAFITNYGLFEPTVMFFGLTNSPATFQTMINAIFTEEIAEGWLIVYMDNILIATKDDLQFHEKCIHRILEKLKQHYLDSTDKKEHPIQLGPILHICLWTPQVTDVCQAYTSTTRLHQSLLSGHRHICLQHGHHTLTGGRTQPQNSKTNALPNHVLLKHLHTNREELQHLWKRILRSSKGPKLF